MTPAHSERPETPARPGHDAVLHLLDRQVIDPEGHLVCKVDDLELTELPDGRLALTALLVGPGALGHRMGGTTGRWVLAVWRRLRPDTDRHPGPARIDAAEVTAVDSAVHIARPAGQMHQLGINGLETWVHDRLIDRLPGATHEPE
jgi:hypothetical protein